MLNSQSTTPPMAIDLTANELEDDSFPIPRISVQPDPFMGG